MPARMAKLYTRTGDDGTTGLHGGQRVSKTDPRVETYGACDELNSFLGHARATCDPARDALIVAALDELQRLLFEIGADLATPLERTGARRKVCPVNDEDVSRLERWIDEATAAVEPQRTFILPGGSELAARLHVARAVCRRVERQVVTLAEFTAAESESEAESDDGGESAHPYGHNIVYLNRASDLLFALARLANRVAGVEDVPWLPRSKGG